MLYSLGRLLQFSALILLPVAMAGNLSERLSVSGMYQLLMLGVGLFVAGWLLQQAGRPGG